MALKDIEQKIIFEAGRKAEEIKKAAEEAARKSFLARERVVIEAELSAVRAAEKEGETIKIEMVSPVKISAKNELLAKKQEMMEKVYKETLSDLKKLGEKSYRQAVLGLLKSLPKGVSGEIVPRAGKEAVTRRAVSAYLKEQKKAPTLLVKKGTKEISGGFIFKSEKFNMDLSFESIMRGVREKTESKVAKIVLQESGG